MPATPEDNGHTSPPTILPVFPLTGMLLLPGNFMPLNIFEPRYRNLVEDVLAGAGHIGMIQPLLPGADNLGLGEEHPALYSMGCAGLLERVEPQADGRYLILLRGVARFRVETEIGMRRGYRRVRASYPPPEQQPEPASGEAVAPLLAAVERFARRRELEFDLELLAALDLGRLVNALAAALPFEPPEQQALLEATGVRRRGELLLALMCMEGGDDEYAPTVAPLTVN